MPRVARPETPGQALGLRRASAFLTAFGAKHGDSGSSASAIGIGAKGKRLPFLSPESPLSAFSRPSGFRSSVRRHGRGHIRAADRFPHDPIGQECHGVRGDASHQNQKECADSVPVVGARGFLPRWPHDTACFSIWRCTKRGGSATQARPRARPTRP